MTHDKQSSDAASQRPTNFDISKRRALRAFTAPRRATSPTPHRNMQRKVRPALVVTAMAAVVAACFVAATFPGLTEALRVTVLAMAGALLAIVVVIDQ